MYMQYNKVWPRHPSLALQPTAHSVALIKHCMRWLLSLGVDMTICAHVCTCV